MHALAVTQRFCVTAPRPTLLLLYQELSLQFISCYYNKTIQSSTSWFYVSKRQRLLQYLGMLLVITTAERVKWRGQVHGAVESGVSSTTLL